MTASLKGDVALVTGAGGGIGSGVALAFAAGGADLCLTDLRVVPQVAERCAALGARVIDAPTDVTDGAKVRALVAAAERELGKVDIVVNVAGTVSFGTAEELPEAEWDRVLEINLKGAFLCCQAVIPGMRRRSVYGR